MQTLHPVPQAAPAAEVEEHDTPLAWELRVLAAALAWTVPGVIAGALAALLLTSEAVSFGGVVAAAGVLSTLLGGLLEAEYWP